MAVGLPQPGALLKSKEGLRTKKCSVKKTLPHPLSRPEIGTSLKAALEQGQEAGGSALLSSERSLPVGSPVSQLLPRSGDRWSIGRVANLPVNVFQRSFGCRDCACRE